MKSSRYTGVMPTPLLMIEDDARLAQMVSDYLAQSGFQVTHAPDGEHGLEQLPLVQPELVILDLMMPGIDGLEVCRRIRALPGDAARVPIIMLTAKGDPMDRIIGLELGADDYLPKPFEPRELLARMRAVMRRRGEVGNGSVQRTTPVLRFGSLEIDRDARTVMVRATRSWRPYAGVSSRPSTGPSTCTSAASATPSRRTARSPSAS